MSRQGFLSVRDTDSRHVVKRGRVRREVAWAARRWEAAVAAALSGSKGVDVLLALALTCMSAMVRPGERVDVGGEGREEGVVGGIGEEAHVACISNKAALGSHRRRL